MSKGQTGLTLLLIYLVLGFCVVAFTEIYGEAFCNSVSQTGGIDSFFFCNMSLWIILLYILGFVGVAKYGF